MGTLCQLLLPLGNLQINLLLMEWNILTQYVYRVAVLILSKNETRNAVQIHIELHVHVITLARVGGGYSNLCVCVCVCVCVTNWCLNSKYKEATALDHGNHIQNVVL